jgi:hypothetical protein
VEGGFIKREKLIVSKNVNNKFSLISYEGMISFEDDAELIFGAILFNSNYLIIAYG